MIVQPPVILHDPGQVVNHQLHEVPHVHRVEPVQRGAELELGAEVLPSVLHLQTHLYAGDRLSERLVTARAGGVQRVRHHLEETVPAST